VFVCLIVSVSVLFVSICLLLWDFVGFLKLALVAVCV